MKVSLKKTQPWVKTDYPQVKRVLSTQSRYRPVGSHCSSGDGFLAFSVMLGLQQRDGFIQWTTKWVATAWPVPNCELIKLGWLITGEVQRRILGVLKRLTTAHWRRLSTNWLCYLKPKTPIIANWTFTSWHSSKQLAWSQWTHCLLLSHPHHWHHLCHCYVVSRSHYCAELISRCYGGSTGR